MLKYTQFVSQAGQAFETIEVLKAKLELKIRVSAVRFCPWPPFKQHSNNKFHGIDYSPQYRWFFSEVNLRSSLYYFLPTSAMQVPLTKPS
jgi:hypothetical protein